MFAAISDLATSHFLQRQGGDLKARFTSAGRELASGLHSNLAAATKGDFRPLLALERRSAVLAAQSQSLARSAAKAQVSGLSLQKIGEFASRTGPELLSAALRGDAAALKLGAANVAGQFAAAIAALNISHGGASLFSGAATDQPATLPAGEILAELRSLTAAASDAAALIAQVDAYFLDPAGGYLNSAYLGSVSDAAATELDENISVQVHVRADDPAIRPVLRDLALAALVAGGALAADPQGQRQVLASSGTGLLSGKDAILALRAGLGRVEELIDDALSAKSAEATALDIQRNDITAADPYEAAARFEALQGQLQAHYTVTARLSRLSLANFLG